MPLQARRVFRLSLTAAMALVVAYMLTTPLPFIAPLFAYILTAKPGPPLGIKRLLGLLMVIIITLGLGLLLIPMLINYQLSALLVVLVGLYFSSYLMVNLNKSILGIFLAMGISLISAAGMVSFSLASLIIEALIINVSVAVLCQLVVYQIFPENSSPQIAQAEQHESAVTSNWIAIRSTIIVFPVYLVLLSNPLAYMPIMIKSVLLSQQSSHLDAKNAVNELIGSTILGGFFAVLLWMLLGLWVNLWMYFLWMLVLSIYFSCKIYQLLASKYPASFWVNTVSTMLIMIGPAVEDSASGSDVYMAFFSRASLLILVSLYALFTISILEKIKTHYGSIRKQQVIVFYS